MPESPIPLDKQIACVKREIAMRRRVYPKWVKDGRLVAAKADDEIAAMEAVLATLQSLPAAAPSPAHPGESRDTDAAATGAQP